MSYPRHKCPFVRVLIFHLHMPFNESWMFSHINFCVHFLSFAFYFFKGGYTLTHTHTHKYRYSSIPDPMGNNTAITFSDSEDLVYQAEYEGGEYCEVPEELARLLQQEERLFCLTRSSWIQ